MIQSNRIDVSTSSSKAVPLLTTHPAASITGLASTTPIALSASGAVGSSTLVARADHSHPTTGLMLTTHVANSITGFGATAAALGTAAPGTATTVSRSDHVHPTTGLVLHAMASVANEFIVSSGAGVFVAKSAAQVKSILGLGSAAYTNHDTSAYGDEHGATSSPTSNAIARRDPLGNLYARLLRTSYPLADDGCTKAYFLTQNNIGDVADNYARPTSLAEVKLAVVTKDAVESVLTGTIDTHVHSTVHTAWNVPVGDVGGNIWIV